MIRKQTLLAVLLVLSLAPCEAQTDTWIQRPNVGGAARQEAVGFSIGTKGYVGLGSVSAQKDFWEYDPVTLAWTQKADYPGSATGDAVGFSIGSKGYVGTGLPIAGVASNDFWEYDPVTNTWTQKADLTNNSIRYGAVGFSIGGKGYIGGGTGILSGFYHGFDDFWEYDPATDTWTQRASLGAGIKSSGVGFSIGGKGYIGTGQTGNGETQDFWEYDPTTDTWTQRSSVPGGNRVWAVGFSMGTKGYIGTGTITSGSPGDTDDFWEYDPGTDMWSQKASVGGGPRSRAFGFSIGDNGFIGTGWAGTNGTDKSDFWEYGTQPDCIGVLGGSALPGTSCDDGLAYTTNDVYSLACVCAGTCPDTDGDGICDGADNCPNLAGVQGDVCNDNNACTINDVITAACVCAGTFQDGDGDGLCDVSDGCPNVAGVPGSTCDDGDVCTVNDVLDAFCACNGSFVDSDGDGICNANDNCPGTFGQIGSSCDDGDPCTTNDVIQVGCWCSGTGLPDGDGDGVCDVTDTCADTPVGEGVNATGCSCSQVPVDDGDPCTVDACVNGDVTHLTQSGDGDLDGVCDAADACPSTPEGEAVNAAGCACSEQGLDDGDACTTDACDQGTVTHIFLDEDGDSVCDTNDGCPGTASGEGVNVNGCSCAQVTVDDGDPCTSDACSNGTVEHVFQDADNDGICDLLDSCPFLYGQNGDACGGGACMSPGTVVGCACTSVPINQPAGDTYATAIPIALNNAGTSTVNGDNLPCNTSTYTGPHAQGSPDVWYTLNTGACASGSLTLSTCAAGTLTDTYLHVLNAAGTSELAFNDDSPCSFGNFRSALTVAVAPNTTYIIVVEGYGNSAPGTYTLAVTVPGAVDSDGDGTRDCNDGCPNDPDKIATGQCGCGVADTDSDNDGVANCNDNCPSTPGQIGSSCDDGNANTTNDVVNGSCVCAGTPTVTCTSNLALEFQLDGISTETWEIRAQGINVLVQSGSAHLNAAGTTVVNTCVPDGCYYLKVTDDAGDGIIGGGYILRTGNGNRIIDDRNNFTSGSVSQITNNGSWCIIAGAIGNDRLVSASCDRMVLRRGTSASCSDALVADATPNNSAANQYRYWIFDPNGTLSFEYPSGTGGTTNQLNMFSLPSLVEGRTYNIRVRTRVSAGVWRAWGPACRLRLNNVAGQCPATQLQDAAGTDLSCGATKALGSAAANKIFARKVSRFNNACASVAATKYQFRFRIPAEGIVIVKNGYQGSNYTFMNMSNLVGTAIPAGTTLQACRTYQVEVRASFNGGTTWCVGGDPYTDLAPWGTVCTLTTSGTGCNNAMIVQSSGQFANGALYAASDGPTLYPNPNQGDQFMLSLRNIEDGVDEVSVAFYDLYGKVVRTHTIAVENSNVNSVVDLNGELANGLYLVHITAGERTWTERLLIQP